MELIKCNLCKHTKDKLHFIRANSLSNKNLPKYCNVCEKKRRDNYNKRNLKLLKDSKCRTCRGLLDNSKDYLCVKCREEKRLQDRNSKKKSYNDRLLNGLCVYCGNPREDLLKSHCNKCIRRFNY